MKHSDVEELARKVGLVNGPSDSYVTQAELMHAIDFAALVLEKAAENHDEAAAEWMRIAQGCDNGMY